MAGSVGRLGRDFREMDMFGVMEPWNFTPEHLKDPESLNRYLRQRCCGLGRSEEAQMIWGLANAYRALFSTIPERERILEIERRIVQAEKESLWAERKGFQAEKDNFWAE